MEERGDRCGKREDEEARVQLSSLWESREGQGKEALPGKQENRGGGSLLMREDLTKGPKGG